MILDVLKAVLTAYPESAFVQSLLRQYQERGGLSKKQLEGLFGKAQKVQDMPASRLATLEALILKKPTRYKSAPPSPKPMYEKDERNGRMIDDILAKNPLHKRVLFLKSKYDGNNPLSPAEILELEKFYKLFFK